MRISIEKFPINVPSRRAPEIKQTWKGLLIQLKIARFTSEYQLEKITESMQSLYPGNYVVDEFFNSNTLDFDLRLKFDTPEEETLFLLKYE